MLLAALADPDWPWDAVRLRRSGLPHGRLEALVTQIRERGLALHLDAADAVGFGDCTVHTAINSLSGLARQPGQRLCVSVHNAADIDAAVVAGADVLLWGHVFATPSKPGRPGHGLTALAAAARQAAPRPLLAVGGIRLLDEAAILAAGAAGWAAIRAPFRRYGSR